MKVLKNCLKCANCCIDTEMLLSNNDIQRINEVETPNFEFFYENDGYLYLLNISGHCIFLNEKNKSCIIYQYRPEGCRFYPYIYDNGKCVIDKDCTNRNNMEKPDKKILEKIKDFIEILETERLERLKEEH